jgi:hypothetical protein
MERFALLASEEGDLMSLICYTFTIPFNYNVHKCKLKHRVVIHMACWYGWLRRLQQN